MCGLQAVACTTVLNTLYIVNNFSVDHKIQLLTIVNLVVLIINFDTILYPQARENNGQYIQRIANRYICWE